MSVVSNHCDIRALENVFFDSLALQSHVQEPFFVSYLERSSDGCPSATMRVTPLDSQQLVALLGL